MNKFHTLKIKEVTAETDQAVTLALEIPADLSETFRFVPGQYLTLRTEIDGEDIRRAYSICSLAGKDLRVGIKKVEGGRFSTHAQSLKAGDEIQVLPPQGLFACSCDPDAKRSILLIAAGSGITPVLSIASHVLETEPGTSVTLIYGNRSTGSIMFRTALEELKDTHLERFHMHHVLSRETQDVDLFSGRVDAGRISAMTQKGLLDPTNEDAIYICGPAEMSLELSSHFESLGVGKERVHVELFEVPGDDRPRKANEAVRKRVEEGVQIDVILDGLRKQVSLTNPDHTVLDAAQAGGLDLPFSCAGGMCATCRCRIIEGEGEMDKNFSLADWELEDGYVLCCQLRPKSGKLVIDFDAA